MTNLVIGGSSGLGLSLAKQLAATSKTIVTGRHDPKQKSLIYEAFELSSRDLNERIDMFVNDLPIIGTLVYAAGYFQEGRITDLSSEEIEEMLDVGGRALIYFTRALLKKQQKLKELITITSTSQWTPRQYEPIYNYVKAGQGHFSNSMAEDGRIGKVLVAGPAGMNTTFWRHYTERDTSEMLDPEWVVTQIMKLRQDKFTYRFAKIMRQPARLEIIETR